MPLHSQLWRPKIRSTYRALKRKIHFGKTLRQPVPETIIPGGFDTLTRYFARREKPYRHIRAVVPRERIDLKRLKGTQLPAASEPVRQWHTQDARKKYSDLRLEFAEQSELLAFHGLIIALLRRREHAPRFRKLFFRMWKEEGDYLATHLPVRWLISSATTFADIGATTKQRMAGQAFALVFDLIKLHDSERHLSGRPNSIAFPKNPIDDRFPLAFDLSPYSLPDGDLEMTMLMRLYRLSGADPVFRPLGERMMQLLMSDNRSVFARIQTYKTRSF